MEQIISKQKLDELIKIKGEIRGVSIKNLQKYLIQEEGEEGFRKLEEAMASLGYPMMYRETKPLDFYPLGREAVILVVIRKLFDYDDEKFQDIGKFQSKYSLIVRTFLKYFVSLDKVAKEAPRFWRKYYTVGDLAITDFNKEKKYVIVRIENFNYVPEGCQIFIGFFPEIIQMITGEKTKCEEKKCPFEGNEYHEFLITW